MGKRHIAMPDKLEGLFIRLEEIVLANSGEDEFEEIFKLIISKLWCEIHDLDTYTVDNEMNKQYKEINNVLLQVDKQWKGVLVETKIKLRPEHLNVCANLLSNYSLLSFGFDALDAFFEFIVSKTSKGSKGQFFTPRYVVDFCIRVLSPKPFESILDPACGSGSFLNHYYNFIKGNDGLVTASTISSNMWGFDFDDRALRVARILMNLAEIPNINLFKTNSLVTPDLQENLFTNNDGEFLTSIEDYLRINKKKEALFDIIATNPPFAGEINEEGILNKYHLSEGKKKIERDALFIERCVRLLKPKGRMAIVLPNNKFGSSQWSYLRQWLFKYVRVIGVVGLPRNVFMPHTPIKTAILFVQKREEPLVNPPYEKIFFGISELAGKDSRGNLVYKNPETMNGQENEINHDLKEIEVAFREFLIEEKIGWVK